MYMRVCKVIENVECRKYYRFRGGQWYGGIATADTVGCNLRCKFCWGWRQRDNPSKYGEFYNSQKVYSKLLEIVNERGYDQVRLSGGEPTLSRMHLLELIGYFSNEGIGFILETNGMLIGYDRNYAEDLSKYRNLHVRVSLKGACEEEFHRLTDADPNAFKLQLKALENLFDYKVSCHPAAMLSFSEEKNIGTLIDRLRSIDGSLAKELEGEYVLLYPHVIEILNRYGLKPRIAYSPQDTPAELI